MSDAAPIYEICLNDATVEGAGELLLPPTTVTAPEGKVTIVASPSEIIQKSLSLTAGGRLRPDHGTCRLVPGSGRARELRDVVALVDTPDVSAPDDSLPLSTVVGEELAMARRPASPGRVREWLDSQHDDLPAQLPIERLSPALRVILLARLAALRPGVRFVVLTAPDRHGGHPLRWWPVCRELTDLGLGVIVTCTPTTVNALPARADRTLLPTHEVDL